MASFEKAFVKTIKYEGGYVNNPNDKGGETYMGVSRKYHPNLHMWEIIDDLKKQFKGKTLNDMLRNNTVVQNDVKSVYKNGYWIPLDLDSMHSQSVANQFFDNAINCGVKATIKIMQRVAGMKETGRMSKNLVEYYANRNKK